MTSYNEIQLIEAVKSSNTWGEVVTHLGLSKSGDSYRHVQSVVKRFGISTDHFYAKVREAYRIPSNEELFSIHGDSFRASPNTVRGRARKVLLPRVCNLCGNPGSHNGSELVLQLDHINGNNLDNRLENLRWLCPNCHSQTSTFSKKKKNSIPSNIIDECVLVCDFCKKNFTRTSSRVRRRVTRKEYCSLICGSEARTKAHISGRKVDHDGIVKRYQEVGSKNRVAKENGISFQAVSKILKKYDL